MHRRPPPSSCSPSGEVLLCCGAAARLVGVWAGPGARGGPGHGAVQVRVVPQYGRVQYISQWFPATSSVRNASLFTPRHPCPAATAATLRALQRSGCGPTTRPSWCRSAQGRGQGRGQVRAGAGAGAGAGASTGHRAGAELSCRCTRVRAHGRPPPWWRPALLALEPRLHALLRPLSRLLACAPLRKRRTVQHCPTWLTGWFWGHPGTAKNLRQLVRGPLKGRARIQMAGERRGGGRRAGGHAAGESNRGGGASSSTRSSAGTAAIAGTCPPPALALDRPLSRLLPSAPVPSTAQATCTS